MFFAFIYVISFYPSNIPCELSLLVSILTTKETEAQAVKQLAQGCGTEPCFYFVVSAPFHEVLADLAKEVNASESFFFFFCICLDLKARNDQEIR